ncbi:MAG: NAD(P)-dependent oxidoreductase [Alphaproteobacteria bacterium]
MAKAAFIGLGIMGYPMAGHLIKNGHEVTVHNRTRSKAEKWRGEFGGRMAATPREAAEGAEIVLTCVGDDPDVENVVLGEDGVFAGLGAGRIYVDHTTGSAELARKLAAMGKERGIEVVDAPVSGGQAGAENGALSIMCGGEEGVFERARPVMESYAKACSLIGPNGAGQLTKMVNQICIAGLVQGLAEALNFGMKAGLDMDKVVAAISKGAAQSWQMENRAGTMCKGEFEFGFPVDWMRKDLRICTQEARSNGARLPVAALVDQFYAMVQARKGSRWDTSSLIHLLMYD